MLKIVPPKYQKRNTLPKKKAQSAPPPTGLTITSVVVQGADSQLRVTFSANITWDGETIPTAFQAFTHDGYLDACIAVVGTGSNYVDLEFNAGIDVGAAWEINAPMDGISPAILVPQSGVTE